MKTLLKLICCLISISAYSQEIIFDWNKVLGNSGHTSGLSIAYDTSEFIYASGTFEGAIDIDGTSLTSTGDKDGFLFKLDSTGSLLWSKQFSSIYDVKINSLSIDKENNLVLLGNYHVKVMFDTIITTNNTDTIYSSNMFIAKFNTDGDLFWAKNTGGWAYGGNTITVDLNNDILITGKSIDITLFDTPEFISTLDSMEQIDPDGSWWYYWHPTMNFLTKYSSDGTMSWIKKIGGNPREIITDNNNNIIVTGNYLENTYFGGNYTPKIGTETSFLAQYSSQGTFNWVKTSGGSANWNSGYGLEIDSANNIYQCGQIFGNDIEFDGNIVLYYAGIDAFLTKYDVNGNLYWYKLIGTPTTSNGQTNNNRGTSLKIDNIGDIMFLGYFKDNLIYDTTTLESEGAPDLMLLRFNPNGDVLSASQYSDYGWVEGIDLIIDNNNDLYLTGYTSLEYWSTDYPNYAFIGKIDYSIPTFPVSIEENSGVSNLLLYPNPSKGDVHLTFSESSTPKRIEVFSIEGRKVNDFETMDSRLSFEIKERGLYLVLITMGSNRVTKKVIID